MNNIAFWSVIILRSVVDSSNYLTFGKRRHKLSPAAFIPSKYLLPGVGGQVEHQHCEEGDSHTWNDQVNRVEERLAAHRQLEGNI